MCVGVSLFAILCTHSYVFLWSVKIASYMVIKGRFEGLSEVLRKVKGDKSETRVIQHVLQ